MHKNHSRIVKIFAFTAVTLVLLLVAGMVKAGSLTPSASPAATMRTLQEIYDSIASTTFDSSSISASSTGSLIQHLKYITNNLFWASSTGNIYYTGGGRVGIGTSTPVGILHVATGTTTGLVVSDAGNVGIGTTTPQYTLDVRGSFGVSGTSTLATTTITNLIVSGTSTLGTSTVTGNINLVTGGSLLTGGTTRLDSIGQGTFTTTTITSLTVSGTSTFSGVISVSSGTLTNFTLGSVLFAGTGGALLQNNANLFWDNTNAWLGIGTTTPPAALTVVAAIPSLSLVDTTSNNNKRYSIRLGSTTANVFDIYDNSSSTSRLVIDGAGNVGVGTTTPATLFTVATTSNIFNVLSNGNVGIGTTTPSNILSVIGTTNISSRGITLRADTWTTTGLGGGISIIAGDSKGANDAGSISITAGGAGTSGIGGAITLTGGGGANGNNSGPISLITGGGDLILLTGSTTNNNQAGNFTLTLGDNGNKVSIGTVEYSGPAITMTAGAGGSNNTVGVGSNVAGGGGAAVIIAGTGGNASGADTNYGGTGGALNFKAGLGGTGTTANGSGGVITFSTAPTISLSERMRITPGGLVGIATTTPAHLLHIVGASSTLALESSAIDGKRYVIRSGGIVTATSSFDIYDFSSSTSRLVIDGAGNVGIGTTTPASLFSVANATTTLLFNVTAQGRVGIGSSTPGGYLTVQSAGSGNTPTFIVENEGVTPFAFVVLDNGSVGIGTSTPGAQFHLVDPGGSGPMFRLDDAPGDTTSFVVSGSDGAVGIGTSTTSGTEKLTIFDNENKLGIGGGGAQIGLGLSGVTRVILSGENSVSSGGTFLVQTANTAGTLQTAMVIRETGNVGIGINNTTPSSTLHVVGTSTFSGNVGVGTTNPTSTLSIAGSSTIENAFTINQGRIYQSGGILLNSDASSSNFTAGYQAGNALLSDGSFNTAIGYQALNTATSSDFNTAVGFQALRLNRAASNTGIGYQSLEQTTTGATNVAVGYNTLFGNTTGYDNAVLGSSAMFTNSTGAQNTALGSSALYSNSTSIDNTAVGFKALYANDTGAQNVAVGSESLQYNTTGSSNVSIGYRSGLGLSLAVNTRSSIDTQMVFVGPYSSRDDSVSTSTTLTNGIAIGYNSKVLASNQIVLGNNSVTSTLLKGSIAIGTSTPLTLLTLHTSTTQPIITLSMSTTTGNETRMYQIRNGSVTSTMFDIYDNTSSTSRLVIDKDGKIGIATTTPSYRMVVGNRVTQSDVSIPYGALCVDDLTGDGCPASPVAGTVYASTTAISAIDVAENYPTLDPTLAPGELVSLVTNDSEPLTNDSSGSIVTGQLSPVVGLIERASSHSRGRLVGVISTAPGVLLGRNVGSGTGELTVNRPVALAGRVPVKVSDENGPISIGDPITASSRPGVGMKATATGKVVGYALEELRTMDIEPGTIMVMIAQNQLYIPEEPTVTIEHNLFSSSIEDMVAAVIDALKEFGVRIEQGIVYMKNLIVEGLTIGSREWPTGITLFDEITHEPYCISVRNGTTVTTSGECALQAANSEEQPEMNDDLGFTNIDSETNNSIINGSTTDRQVTDGEDQTTSSETQAEQTNEPPTADSVSEETETVTSDTQPAISPETAEPEQEQPPTPTSEPVESTTEEPPAL